jgi:hypothetical protein
MVFTGSSSQAKEYGTHIIKKEKLSIFTRNIILYTENQKESIQTHKEYTHACIQKYLTNT